MGIAYVKYGFSLAINFALTTNTKPLFINIH